MCSTRETTTCGFARRLSGERRGFRALKSGKYLLASARRLIRVVCFVIPMLCSAVTLGQTWSIDTQQDWQQAKAESEHIELTEIGLADSTQAVSSYASSVKTFATKTKANAITFKQTTAWDNWQPIKRVRPRKMRDAPVFIPVKQGEYWLLARHADYNDKLDGGYHAWHSSDMKTWEHRGAVSGLRERWMTTAEYVDGTFYLYYDHPNDEDPHLILDKDLGDGKVGEDKGMVFADPSHGSDCAIFRDEDGSFHLIYENWDPINASSHAWDSPLAGHAVSRDGIHDFKTLAPVIDHRTKPTGKMGKYVHGTTKRTYEYEIHKPEQPAYGDWTAVKVGGQYYLFCDYDPVGGKIHIGRFTSDSLDKQFEFVGELGDGHPDPTVGFAEDKFYLIQQRSNNDFVSPGPWVGGVTARVGVDTNGDGAINQWTQWQAVSESYTQKPGFVRVVETRPASLDLASLPAGFGFSFEYKTSEVADTEVTVQMDSVEITFASEKQE